MSLIYKTKDELIKDMKRILKLMEEEHIVEDDVDAKKEGYKNLEGYNYVVELDERVKDFIQKARNGCELNGEEFCEKNIKGIKESWLHVQLLRKLEK